METSNVVSTVWGETFLSAAFNLSDLEDTFSLENSPTPATTSAMKGHKKQVVTTLLDITRANNVGR